LLILRTLASLDSDAPRYYTQERNDAVAQADEETQKWLDFASEVDNVARLLIRVAVRSAAEVLHPRIEAFLDAGAELADMVRARAAESREERVRVAAFNRWMDRGGPAAPAARGKRHVVPKFGRQRLADVSLATVMEWIDEQRAAGELSESSIRNNMNLLSRFLLVGDRARQSKINPVRQIPMVAGQRRP